MTIKWWFQEAIELLVWCQCTFKFSQLVTTHTWYSSTTKPMVLFIKQKSFAIVAVIVVSQTEVNRCFVMWPSAKTSLRDIEE